MTESRVKSSEQGQPWSKWSPTTIAPPCFDEIVAVTQIQWVTITYTDGSQIQYRQGEK